VTDQVTTSSSRPAAALVLGALRGRLPTLTRVETWLVQADRKCRKVSVPWIHGGVSRHGSRIRRVLRRFLALPLRMRCEVPGSLSCPQSAAPRKIKWEPPRMGLPTQSVMKPMSTAIYHPSRFQSAAVMALNAPFSTSVAGSGRNPRCWQTLETQRQ